MQDQQLLPGSTEPVRRHDLIARLRRDRRPHPRPSARAEHHHRSSSSTTWNSCAASAARCPPSCTRAASSAEGLDRSRAGNDRRGRRSLSRTIGRMLDRFKPTLFPRRPPRKAGTPGPTGHVTRAGSPLFAGTTRKSCAPTHARMLRVRECRSLLRAPARRCAARSAFGATKGAR